MGLTVGIDLGTTNSAVCIKKINVASIKNKEGDELTPSYVTILTNSNNNNEYIVGQRSKNLAKQYPKQTINSVKRLIGRDFNDAEIQDIIKKNKVSYAISTDDLDPGSIKIDVAGKKYIPETISGIILDKVIRDSEAELHGDIDHAVVTVPAYFSDSQKYSTRLACEYAKLKVLRLLPEPTAAAISFGLLEQKNIFQTIMVFDLGGGTFDISILSLANGSFMEVTKGGDMWLGGDDIDKIIIDYVYKITQETAHCKPINELIDSLPSSDKARFLLEIKEKAEAAKISLSTENSVNIEVFGILKDENNSLVDIDVTLDKEKFAQLIEPIIKRVLIVTRHILDEINFERDLIDTVLMVGGSSLIPAIQNALKEVFGAEKVKIHPRPMLAIAEGAALMAAKMTGAEISEDQASNAASFNLMHSAAHDYYLQLANGNRHLLIARNTPLPAVFEEKLRFNSKEQHLARLRVFNDVGGIFETVGELWIHDDDSISSKNKSREEVEFTLRFSVDEDNIITMKTWQNEQSITESKIARGGIVLKLYNNLEFTLSSLISHCDDANTEYDILRLSKNIALNILKINELSDASEKDVLRQKINQQINFLKGCQEKDLAPISIYRFAKIAQNATLDILDKSVTDKIADIITQMEQQIDELDDANKFKQIFDKLDQEIYKAYPIACDLAMAENVVSNIKDAGFKGGIELTAIIRQITNELIDSFKAKNLEQERIMRDKLKYTIYSSVSYNNEPLGHFERDVRL